MKNIKEKLIKMLQINGRKSTVFTKVYSDSSELTECFRQQISFPRRA